MRAVLSFAVLSFIVIVSSSVQTCENCSPVCGRPPVNQDSITLTCQSVTRPAVSDCSALQLDALDIWRVNNTILNTSSQLYHVNNTCNDSHVTFTVTFRMKEDTYGCYECANTANLTFTIFKFNQNCCEPICIGVGCNSTSTTQLRTTRPTQSLAISTISTAPLTSASITVTSLPKSTTSIVPSLTPSPSPESPSFQITPNILYAAIACVLLMMILLILMSILVCTIQCWKKRWSQRITVDKHGSFAETEKSPPCDIIETEIKSTSLSHNGSHTINISSPVPDSNRLLTSSPQTIVIIPPATPSTPPTPRETDFSQQPAPSSAKGYNKLFVTAQNPTLLTRSPSPEAVYSQLTISPEENTTRSPIPVVPPQVPSLNNSSNQVIQDNIAAKEHLYFMLDTPEQPQDNSNLSTNCAVNEGHIYQVLDTSENQPQRGNETPPSLEISTNRTNTLLLPPPLAHTSNDYAEIAVCVVPGENRDIPPPPPKQPPPSSKPPHLVPSPPSPPSRPPPPSHPPPSHPPPPPSCPPPPSHPPPPPSCPPPPSHPPPPPLCPPPPTHHPPPPSRPPPPSHPPPPSRPPPPSHPPPPSYPPPPSISPPIQSSIPRHGPTDYEDVSRTCTLPKKLTKSSKQLPAEYEIPLSKTLPRRPKAPMHDPDDYVEVDEDEPSTLVRGVNGSSVQPFVANKQQRSFRRMQPPKQLTLSYDRLPQVEVKTEENAESNLRRHNSQKIKMKIRHNDRIKITTSPQRPSIAPPHFAKSPSQSPQNGNKESCLTLNDIPLREADYDKLRLKN